MTSLFSCILTYHQVMTIAEMASSSSSGVESGEEEELLQARADWERTAGRAVKAGYREGVTQVLRFLMEVINWRIFKYLIENFLNTEPFYFKIDLFLISILGTRG